jgi:hypothetical protein
MDVVLRESEEVNFLRLLVNAEMAMIETEGPESH